MAHIALRNHADVRQAAGGRERALSSVGCVPSPPTRERGDISILLTFLTLIVLLLGATTVVVLTIGNLRGSRDVSTSAAAFTAADTGVEYALHVYNWDALSPTDAAPSCLGTLTDQAVGDLPTDQLRYDLTVDARKEDGSTEPKACDDGDVHSNQDPFASRLANGTVALCIEARGEARGGVVQRRVTNDIFGDDNPTCGR